jgi:tetratricopeptide (TPR) repeat protein
MCTPCRQLAGVGSDHAPEFGSDFWHTDQMRDAFATRDMGTVVRTYRYHPAHGHKPLPQEAVSRWLGTVGQSQLSRIESGVNRVDTIDKLVHFAQALKMPADLLWFQLPVDDNQPLERSGVEIFALPGGPLVPAASLRTGSALSDSLIETLDRYVATDNLAGPHSLIGIIPQQIRFIDDLLSTAHGKDRQRLLYAGARYAEFAGWIFQDAGAMDNAMQMSNAALDYAQEADNDRLSAYILMRRSNIAADAKRPELALKLIDSAMRNEANLSSRQRAVMLRQRAFTYALLGNSEACGHALEDAFRLADRGVDSADDLANYCTPEYLEMEAAHCWVELGQADRAIDTLQHGLSLWNSDYRRDLGLCLARLGVAHASGGQAEYALTVAQHALRIARETKSHRTAMQLARIPVILADGDVAEGAWQLDRQLKSLRP